MLLFYDPVSTVWVLDKEWSEVMSSLGFGSKKFWNTVRIRYGFPDIAPSSLLYLLNSVKQRNFCAFYGNRRFITAFTRDRHLSLSWARSIQSLPSSHLSKIHFDIVLPSMPGFSKWFPSLSFPHQNPVCTSPLPHTYCMPCPSPPSWFNHPNIIWWGVQSMKLFVM